MANPNAIAPEIGKWKPGESGNPAGRQKKIYTVIKEMGYSLDDLKTALAEMGWLSLEELQEVFNDKTKPAILKVIAHAYKKGAEKGDFRYVKDILEHSIGKPKQDVEIKANIELTSKYTLPDGTEIAI